MLIGWPSAETQTGALPAARAVRDKRCSLVRGTCGHIGLTRDDLAGAKEVLRYANPIHSLLDGAFPIRH